MRLDYSFEIAGQSGSWAGDSLSAWMGHGLLGRTLSNSPGLPRVSLECTGLQVMPIPATDVTECLTLSFRSPMISTA
jgi:hypothetical protein